MHEVWKEGAVREVVKAGFHMIVDDRESQIVDRRKFCDRLRSYGNPLLRSFAILQSYGNQRSAMCDRNVSHNNFNSDSNDSKLLSNKA